MSLYLCVYLPMWSTDLVQRDLPDPEKHRPLLLAHNHGGASVVMRASTAAQAFGVTLSTPMVLAQALAPECVIRPFTPQHDLRSLYKLARWMLRYTPVVGFEGTILAALKSRDLVNLDPEYWGVVLDITGTERVHKGIPRLVETIVHTFKRWRVAARVAVAPSLGAAWALSRYAAQTPTLFMTSDQTLRQALDPLPITALRLSEPIVDALHSLGIINIAQLRALPRKKLPARFGAEILLQLDRTIHGSHESFRAVRTPQPFVIQKECDPPLTDLTQITHLTVDLFAELLSFLAHYKKIARRYQFRFEDQHRRSLDRELTLYAPSTSRGHLFSLLTPFTDKLSFPDGVLGITITACDLSAYRGDQHKLFQRGTVPDMARETGELLNHFTQRLGHNQVRQAVFQPSYIPEKSYAFLPYGSAVKESSAQDRFRAAVPFHFAPHRPPVFLSPAEPAEAVALLPDKPPSQIVWRGVRRRVIVGTGPEMITPEWWSGPLHEISSSSPREYFRIQQSSGEWLWIFREAATMRWFVQGVWI